VAPTRETAEPTTIVRGRPPRIRTAWRPATAARALVPERGDLLVGLIYLALAAAVLSGQWRDT